jgi:phosphatidylglycerol:prolipoprotein diacylglycerol transferase
VNPILWSFHAPLLGLVELPAYFTLLTVGFACAMWITFREAKKIDLDPQRILDANLWMVVWGIIGSRVLHIIADGHFTDYINLCVDPKKVPAIDPPTTFCNVINNVDQCAPDFICDLTTHHCYPPKDCFAMLEVWRGGFAYYGGFIAAVLFAMWYLRRHKLPIGRTSDLAGPAISLGLFFGRMGCFLNGCCYGKVTYGPFGVRFPGGPGSHFASLAWKAQYDSHLVTASQNAIPVHPTQLYEAISCLAISAILYFVVRPRKRHDGDVIAAFMLLYAIARTVIEIFRDDERGAVGWLSTSQFLSIPLAGIAIFIFWWVRRKKPAPAAAAAA